VNNFRPPSGSTALAVVPVYGPCFSGRRPPLPMGCRVCGHPPQAHGCDHVEAHEYEVPSADQMVARLGGIRALGLDVVSMPASEWVRPHECATEPVSAEAFPAQPVALVPAPRRVEQRPVVSTPAVEAREERKMRLARAVEPRVVRRALAVATAERQPYLVANGDPDEDLAALRPLVCEQEETLLPGAGAGALMLNRVRRRSACAGRTSVRAVQRRRGVSWALSGPPGFPELAGWWEPYRAAVVPGVAA
jgi:hypothetical protein